MKSALQVTKNVNECRSLFLSLIAMFAQVPGQVAAAVQQVVGERPGQPKLVAPKQAHSHNQYFNFKTVRSHKA